uniref:Uncharacterized protein n=1 Tax=Siphoviridae sp. ct6d71 TaxID=2826298 RepID=A0A8S5R1R0_9CAUD|nr:MAG TPA: hypothetical protein [Siphoviridae sp. ct6d71]
MQNNSMSLEIALRKPVVNSVGELWGSVVVNS